jgi:hypothetical protein
MIPEHLKNYNWLPAYFYKTPQGAVGINQLGIEEICKQAGLIGMSAKCPSCITSQETGPLITIGVELKFKSKKDGKIYSFESVASACWTEFTSKDNDRRKYHLAQMARARAKEDALTSYIGASNADLDAIAQEVGWSEAKKYSSGPTKPKKPNVVLKDDKDFDLVG